MVAGRCLFYIAVSLAIGACNLRRPEVTLTLAPIETRTPQATDLLELPTETRVAQLLPSPTVQSSSTAQSSPTDSNNPTLTDTVAPTLTATDQPAPTETSEPTSSHTHQPTVTQSPAPSATATIPPSDTAVRTATATATATAVPSVTDSPVPSSTHTSAPSATLLPSPTRILPRTATDTATPTAIPEIVLQPLGTVTSEATATTLSSLPPTLTPLPTLDATELARLIARPVAQATAPATWTAAPTALPSAAPVASTPLPASATPGADRSPASTPLPSTAQPEFGAATFTPTPVPTRFQPTVAVRQELIVEQIPPPVFAPASINTAGAAVYQYDVGFDQPFNFQGLQLQGGVALFAPNPVAPDSYLRTDQVGMLWYRPVGAANEGAMSFSPFHEGYGAPSSELNKNRVVEIDWSADGAQFSFRIDTPPGQDNVNAGVWFWQPLRESPTDPTYAVIRDCARDDYNSCQIVNRGNAQFWKTIAVDWSPIRGSGDILLTLQLPAEGRQALAVVQAVRDADYAKNAPEFFRYDYGHWNTDGSGIVVSGRRADGRVIIGEVNSDLRGERLVYDATAAGLWLQDAARRANGQIVALGRPGAPHDTAPLSLYNSSGARLSGPIGEAAPELVSWYADRSAVVLSVLGRQYTVSVDGGRITDSTDLTRNPSFGTVNIGEAPVPAAVIQNSEYFPGQQLRALRNLNLREGPSTGHAIIGGLFVGDYVAILAGPYDNQGYRWWRVQTAVNALGWIAGTIGGSPTVGP